MEPIEWEIWILTSMNDQHSSFHMQVFVDSLPFSIKHHPSVNELGAFFLKVQFVEHKIRNAPVSLFTQYAKFKACSVIFSNTTTAGMYL